MTVRLRIRKVGELSAGTLFTLAGEDEWREAEEHDPPTVQLASVYLRTKAELPADFADIEVFEIITGGDRN